MHASTVHPEHRVGEAVLAGAVSAVATVAVAGIASLATSVDRDWYRSLDEPEFMPPDTTFDIVRPILDVAIAVAVAGWSAWRAARTPLPTTWSSSAWNRPSAGSSCHPADRSRRRRCARVGARQRRRRRAGAPDVVWCCVADAPTIGVRAGGDHPLRRRAGAHGIGTRPPRSALAADAVTSC